MATISGVRYSRGNTKVGVDTIIINITSAHKCMSLAQNWKNPDGSFKPGAPDWARRGENLCQVPIGTCYAWKSENLYRDHVNKKTGKIKTGCLHNRDEQTKIWDGLTAEQFADAIKAIVDKENRSMSRNNTVGGRPVPIKYVRFQESGDFRSQADVQKMSRIADLIQPKGIKAYTYTAREDLNFTGLSPNLLINGSNFMKPGVDSSFKVVDTAGYNACPKGRPPTFDCNNCEDQCKSPRCRGIKNGGCMGCKLCKTGGGKIIREYLQQGSKKDMEALRKGRVKGDEHGGVEGLINDPSEILELGPATVKKVAKPARKVNRKTAPAGFGGLR